MEEMETIGCMGREGGEGVMSEKGQGLHARAGREKLYGVGKWTSSNGWAGKEKLESVRKRDTIECMGRGREAAPMISKGDD